MKKILFSLVFMFMAQGALACTPGLIGGPNGDPYCMAPIFEQQRMMQEQSYPSSSDNEYGSTIRNYIPINYWGAIAVSASTGTIVASNNQDSEQSATDNALKKCKQKDCEVAMTYKNGYLAVAIGVNAIGKGDLFFVSRDDPTDAKLKAMYNCQQKKMKNCRIYMVEKSLPQEQRPVNYWGAIAVSASTGTIVASNNQDSEQSATDNALKKCKQKDCEVAMTYKNGYLAVAIGVNAIGKGDLFFVSRDDPTDAKLKAMYNCQQKKMKNCRIYMVEKSLAP